VKEEEEIMGNRVILGYIGLVGFAGLIYLFGGMVRRIFKEENKKRRREAKEVVYRNDKP